MADVIVARHPEFSVPSIVAVIAAVGSFMAGAFLGMILAIVAIIAGAIGLILSMAPSIRGGIMSFVSITLGLVGIIAAVFKLFF